MKTDIQEKFELFRRKEKAIRRVTIVMALIPLILGALWILYSWKRVNALQREYDLLQKKSKLEQLQYNELLLKKQNLEIELVQTYGLPKDSIENVSNRDTIIKTSLSANDAVISIKPLMKKRLSFL